MSARVSPELAPPKISPHVISQRRSFFRSLLHRESFCAWIFIAPALVGFSVFYLLPTSRAIYISFTDWNLLRAPVFNAGANYVKLWNDPNFWNSMKMIGGKRSYEMNGTFFDGVRIETALLSDGAEVQIGKFRLTFYASRLDLARLASR